jgi:hypothetical protein
MIKNRERSEKNKMIKMDTKYCIVKGLVTCFHSLLQEIQFYLTLYQKINC